MAFGGAAAAERSLRHEIARVASMYDEKAAHCGRLEVALRDVRRTLGASEADAQRLSSLAHRAQEERVASLKVADSATAYAKRLEGKVLSGEGAFLLRQNVELKSERERLGFEVEALGKANRAQAAELERAASEIEVLATALELRVDELSATEGADLRSALLFETAARQEEAARLRKDLDAATAQREALAAEGKHLHDQLSEAHNDVAMLSDRVAKLSASLEEASAARTAAEHRAHKVERERDVALDFVADQSERVESAVAREGAAEKRAAALHDATVAAEASRASAVVREVQARALAENLQALMTRDAEERVANGRRVEVSDAAAQAAAADATAAKAALAAVNTAHAELKVAVDARSTEVAALREQVRVLTAEGAAKQEVLDASPAPTLRRELAAAKAAAADAGARAAVSQLAVGRLEQAVQAAAAQLTGLHAMHATEQAGWRQQVAVLREKLAAEQAARHASVAKLAVLEGAEQGARQQAADAARAEPRQPRKKVVVASPADAAAAAAAAATLVREALRSAGLDGTLADEFMAHSRSAPALPTQPQPFSSHVHDVRVARNYVEMAGIQPAAWTAQLRSDTAAVGLGASGRGASGAGPLSPGSTALANAVERARGKADTRQAVSARDAAMPFDDFLGAAARPEPVVAAADLASAYETYTLLS
jgi:chromosome segregation ATPase